MTFYGRHKVYTLFWPWAVEPFMVTEDVIQGTVGKSCEVGSRASMTLYPRKIPMVAADGSIRRHFNAGYMDVLAPNDWVFIFVDPQDGDAPEPLFMGLLDRVSIRRSVSSDGSINESIDVSATGWEKVCKQTQALSNPYLADQINFVNLYALGSLGQQPEISADEDTPPSRATNLGLFNDKITRAISYFMRLFLRTNSNPLTSSNVTTTIAKTLETSATVDKDISSRTPGNAALFGQFELPQVGIPLWYFIKLKFEDVKQKAYINPSMFLNQVNQSLARIIDSFRNPLINDLIYDVRRISNDGLSDIDQKLDRDVSGGFNSASIKTLVSAAGSVNPLFGSLVDDIAPYMILRKRPLFVDELIWLDGPVVSEDEFTEKDVGSSDADLHNLTMINLPGVHNNSTIRAQSGFAGLNAYKEETVQSIKRHGIRMYSDSTPAWPDPTGVNIAPLPDPALARDWELRLHRAGLDNVINFSGSFLTPKYLRDLFLGGKLGVIPNNKGHLMDNEKPRVYYVDGIDFSYSNVTGNFETSITVTRGQETDLIR